tara:strand:+ start:11170 stop:11526 length:357 start_codon:yes stop_codon:yes gene_type:complete
MTWFDLVKSSEMKEFELLAEKYAEPNDMKHLDYIRKKHGKRSNEFYDLLNKQVKDAMEENKWYSISDLAKKVKELNPNLKYGISNIEQVLKNRIDDYGLISKQETSVGRTGKTTYYRV